MERNADKVAFLGTTSDVETCDCCGRTNLKKTIALMVNDFPVYYGSECAAFALGMRKTAIIKRANAAQKIRDYEANRETAWSLVIVDEEAQDLSAHSAAVLAYRSEFGTR